MSEYDVHFSDTRYSTPVPELDDHRNQSASVQRTSRSRRGTVDTLYGNAGGEIAQALRASQNVANADNGFLGVSARDFESAIEDDRGYSPARGHPSPVIAPGGRRGTASTIDARDDSPPNSVKAFAQARRRERDASDVTSHSVRAFRENRNSVALHRTSSAASGGSRRTRRSRRCTNDADARSVVPSVLSEAEDDVCFPQQGLPNNRDKRKLYIDFDMLEEFIAEEEREHTPPKNQPAPPRIFNDLRQHNHIHLPKIFDHSGSPVLLPSGDTSLNATTTEDDLDEKFGRAQQREGQPNNNRFSFFSSAWEATTHANEFGDLIMPGEDVRGLFELPETEEDGVWWLNVNNATEEEIRAICKAFGVHPLTIEDIEKQETREKIELFPSYYFACFRSFQIVENDGEREYEPLNIYVIVFREGTISFSFAPNEHAAHVRKRITALKEYIALSSDWICYALMSVYLIKWYEAELTAYSDDIVDGFAPEITRLERDSDNIEDQVFIARSDDMHVFLRTIGACRKDTMQLMKLIGGKADVLRGFSKRCNENYNVTPRMDIGLYLSDIQDHVVTMMSNLGHFEKILSRSHSNYLAQLSIDNITQGNNANRVLSKITLLASILVPLNLVCGMFGMNVPVPWGNDVEPDMLGPFFGILGVLILFVICALIGARRMRYI